MDAKCGHQASQYNACAVSHTCHTHGELSMYLGNLYEGGEGREGGGGGKRVLYIGCAPGVDLSLLLSFSVT